MTVPPRRLAVLVNGAPVVLWQGARVKDALISAAGGRRLVRPVEAGTHLVLDEGVGAEVGLGGALYPGQRLRVAARQASQTDAKRGRYSRGTTRGL